MEDAAAVEAFAALAQSRRMTIFRLLMRAGPDGLTAGEIARAVGTPPSTLSPHLAQMTQAGLLRAARRDRRIYYAADVEGTRRLVSFLTDDCCQGRPEICGYGMRVIAGGLSRTEEKTEVTDKIYNVLFLCTGNSARSILAECILNREGMGRFKAYSAGSHPKGEVHPYALDLLRSQNYPVDELRSKGWEEFSEPDAPEMDFVFTVCDQAAAEVCPVWPGQPMTAHWGIPDPAAVEGTEAVKRAAFADAMRFLTNRISIFVNLPMDGLDSLALQKRLREIGQAVPEDA